MSMVAHPIQWILGILLILGSLGVITARKPIYSALSFLLTLFLLAVFYLLLSAQFIATMQVLVYAGAILVIFVFVIVLFQDAHEQLAKFAPKSKPFLLYLSASLFLLTLVFLGQRFLGFELVKKEIPTHYGTVQSLGEALYLDFFFPFEAVVLLFLVAGIGALYIAKKEK
jgi:NADH-quinone oxidoreductase subunit J